MKQDEKLKLIELEIFKEFVNICERYNFRYYLIGGTLLGAVRHQGFIPWDDDIDVGMPREDYDKFLNVAQDMLSSHLFLQTNKSDPEYPSCYCKIRNSNTTFIETAAKKLKINHGIFIDVFPLDAYPFDKKLKNKFERKKKFYNRIIGTAYYNANDNLVGKMKETFKKTIAFFYPVKKAVTKLEKLYLSQTNQTVWANNSGAWGAKEICPAEWYCEGVELEFEGIKVMGPKNYDLWLTQVYGDYMKLPPKEKRITHHYTEVIDTEKSYKEYLK